ncbi:zinc metallochaperone AztD [Sanguibacter sp. 25GB23B1]|uniref:zinc metallochaperone AztD n=1 Tax=unclassified Sanguibacter TaxID=2645534 RepID=UPI0032AE8FAB
MTLSTPPRRRSRLSSGSALGLGLVLPLAILAGCSTDDSAAGATTGSATTEAAEESAASEAATVTPRLALTYDGGIQVLDATTLEQVADIELDGFNRLNGAGDGHHVFVSTTGGFQLLDAGTWAEPHGDHAHYYTSEPRLTDVTFAADKPGHVVVHDGRTVLFDDGTGDITVLDSDEVAEPEPELREYTTPSAHHGVAVELEDGTLVVSQGTEDERTGIRVLDASGTEIAASDACPGVHGEAVAADDAVVIGCEDGAVVYSGGAITKVQSPDAYGRIGNQSGTEASPIILGDYKSDPDAELERPTRVSLIDTRTSTVRLVDLPSSYTFRSLGRGDAGEALVLGTDGQLHVIDPESGTLVRSVPVIAAWEEPEEWQSPRPTLTVLDGSAYITDPSTNTIHAVDILTGDVWNTAELTVTPNELTGVSGDIETGAHEHADDEHSDEEHADEEHADEEHADEEHADEEHADDHSDEDHADDDHADEPATS